MGLKFKVDGVEQPSGESGHIEPQEIQMTPDMTERMWSIINENTGLQQQITLLKSQLESIKRIVAE